MRTCDCFWCRAGREHPVSAPHDEFHRLSDRLLVDESLRPEDRIQVWACCICGHLVTKP